MEYFLRSESEDESKPFATIVAVNSVKEERNWETEDPTEPRILPDLFDVHVKIEPLDTEQSQFSHLMVNEDVSLSEGPIKKESDVSDGVIFADDTHIVPNPGVQMEVCVIKESCSSPTLDEFIDVEDEDIHKCRFCQESFNNDLSLIVHMQIHDKEKAKIDKIIRNTNENGETVCKMCGMHFTNLCTYLKHRQKHLFKKPFKCEICEKEFNTKYLLTNHERIHTGERPFSCHLCEKKFKEKVALTRHKRTHLETKPYQCDVCSQSFSMKQNLIMHIKYLHMKTHSIKKQRPFKCEFCEKRWICKQALKRHLRTHTGERPYTCHICNKTYTRKSGLSYHIRSHNNDRRFACEICNMRFLSSSDCKKHLITHRNK